MDEKKICLKHPKQQKTKDITIFHEIGREKKNQKEKEKEKRRKKRLGAAGGGRGGGRGRRGGGGRGEGEEEGEVVGGILMLWFRFGQVMKWRMVISLFLLFETLPLFLQILFK